MKKILAWILIMNCVFFTACSPVLQRGDLSAKNYEYDLSDMESYGQDGEQGDGDELGYGKLIGTIKTLDDPKYQLPGQNAFYIIHGHDNNPDEILDFKVLDYVEERDAKGNTDPYFVYAYSTLMIAGVASEYTPEKKFSEYPLEGLNGFEISGDGKFLQGTVSEDYLLNPKDDKIYGLAALYSKKSKRANKSKYKVQVLMRYYPTSGRYQVLFSKLIPRTKEEMEADRDVQVYDGDAESLANYNRAALAASGTKLNCAKLPGKNEYFIYCDGISYVFKENGARVYRGDVGDSLYQTIIWRAKGKEFKKEDIQVSNVVMDGSYNTYLGYSVELKDAKAEEKLDEIKRGVDNISDDDQIDQVMEESFLSGIIGVFNVNFDNDAFYSTNTQAESQMEAWRELSNRGWIQNHDNSNFLGIFDSQDAALSYLYTNSMTALKTGFLSLNGQTYPDQFTAFRYGNGAGGLSLALAGVDDIFTPEVNRVSRNGENYYGTARFQLSYADWYGKDAVYSQLMKDLSYEERLNTQSWLRDSITKNYSAETISLGTNTQSGGEISSQPAYQVAEEYYDYQNLRRAFLGTIANGSLGFQINSQVDMMYMLPWVQPEIFYEYRVRDVWGVETTRNTSEEIREAASGLLPYMELDDMYSYRLGGSNRSPFDFQAKDPEMKFVPAYFLYHGIRYEDSANEQNVEYQPISTKLSRAIRNGNTNQGVSYLIPNTVMEKSEELSSERTFYYFTTPEDRENAIYNYEHGFWGSSNGASSEMEIDMESEGELEGEGAAISPRTVHLSAVRENITVPSQYSMKLSIENYTNSVLELDSTEDVGAASRRGVLFFKNNQAKDRGHLFYNLFPESKKDDAAKTVLRSSSQESWGMAGKISVPGTAIDVGIVNYGDQSSKEMVIVITNKEIAFFPDKNGVYYDWEAVKLDPSVFKNLEAGYYLSEEKRDISEEIFGKAKSDSTKVTSSSEAANDVNSASQFSVLDQDTLVYSSLNRGLFLVNLKNKSVFLMQAGRYYKTILSEENGNFAAFGFQTEKYSYKTTDLSRAKFYIMDIRGKRKDMEREMVISYLKRLIMDYYGRKFRFVNVISFNGQTNSMIKPKTEEEKKQDRNIELLFFGTELGEGGILHQDQPEIRFHALNSLFPELKTYSLLQNVTSQSYLKVRKYREDGIGDPKAFSEEEKLLLSYEELAEQYQLQEKALYSLFRRAGLDLEAQKASLEKDTEVLKVMNQMMTAGSTQGLELALIELVKTSAGRKAIQEEDVREEMNSYSLKLAAAESQNEVNSSEIKAEYDSSVRQYLMGDKRGQIPAYGVEDRIFVERIETVLENIDGEALEETSENRANDVTNVIRKQKKRILSGAALATELSQQEWEDYLSQLLAMVSPDYSEKDVKTSIKELRELFQIPEDLLSDSALRQELQNISTILDAEIWYINRQRSRSDYDSAGESEKSYQSFLNTDYREEEREEAFRKLAVYQKYIGKLIWNYYLENQQAIESNQLTTVEQKEEANTKLSKISTNENQLSGDDLSENPQGVKTPAEEIAVLPSTEQTEAFERYLQGVLTTVKGSPVTGVGRDRMRNSLVEEKMGGIESLKDLEEKKEEREVEIPNYDSLSESEKAAYEGRNLK